MRDYCTCWCDGILSKKTSACAVHIVPCLVCMIVVVRVRTCCVGINSGRGCSPPWQFWFRVVEALNKGREGKIDPAAAATCLLLISCQRVMSKSSLTLKIQHESARKACGWCRRVDSGAERPQCGGGMMGRGLESQCHVVCS